MPLESNSLRGKPLRIEMGDAVAKYIKAGGPGDASIAQEEGDEAEEVLSQ